VRPRQDESADSRGAERFVAEALADSRRGWCPGPARLVPGTGAARGIAWSVA
jgi:hypothetical protein